MYLIGVIGALVLLLHFTGVPSSGWGHTCFTPTLLDWAETTLFLCNTETNTHTFMNKGYCPPYTTTQDLKLSSWDVSEFTGPLEIFTPLLQLLISAVFSLCEIRWTMNRVRHVCLLKTILTSMDVAMAQNSVLIYFYFCGLLLLLILNNCCVNLFDFCVLHLLLVSHTSLRFCPIHSCFFLWLYNKTSKLNVPGYNILACRWLIAVQQRHVVALVVFHGPSQSCHTAAQQQIWTCSPCIHITHTVLCCKTHGTKSHAVNVCTVNTGSNVRIVDCGWLQRCGHVTSIQPFLWSESFYSCLGKTTIYDSFREGCEQESRAKVYLL